MFSLKKRGCDCATDEWRRIFIMVATLFLIAAFFISLARNFIHPTIFSVWSIILFIVGLMNIVVTRQFIMRLNDEECFPVDELPQLDPNNPTCRGDSPFRYYFVVCAQGGGERNQKAAIKR
jgi:hypothetical protein